MCPFCSSVVNRAAEDPLRSPLIRRTAREPLRRTFALRRGAGGGWPGTRIAISHILVGHTI